MSRNLFFFLLFLSMVAWGGSWVNVKIMGHYVDAFEMIFLRFGIAALSMIPIIWFLGYSLKITRKGLFLVLLTSVTLILYNKYYYLGTKFGTASLGGAMVTTLIPILTFLFLAFVGARTITPKHQFALALGAVGVLTMLHVWTFDAAHILVIQNLYFLLAAILWSALTIISAKSTELSPIVFTFYMYVVSTLLDALFFVDFKAFSLSGADGIFWFNLLFMSLGATTFANTFYFLGIEKLGAADVSSFVFLVPFSAIGLSALFLDEPLDLFIIIGTILTLWSVKTINNISLRGRGKKLS